MHIWRDGRERAHGLPTLNNTTLGRLLHLQGTEHFTLSVVQENRIERRVKDAPESLKLPQVE